MHHHHSGKVLKSQADVEMALEAITARRNEVNAAIEAVLNFLAPSRNRRSLQLRRSGFDRRALRDAASNNRRNSSDRRTRSDRRMPPHERLLELRHELEQMMRLTHSVWEWQHAI